MKTYTVRGCTQCDSCRWVCPAGAISFDLAGAHIDQDRCVGCGACRENCASEAILGIDDHEEGLPDRTSAR